MSYESKKGYSAERAVELLWNQRGRPVTRPRAGAHTDVGDLVGLPVVQSVKNHKTVVLSTWVDDLRAQCGHAGLDAGVVWHKRPGKGSPSDWYVTTWGGCAVTLLEGYFEAVAAR